MPGDAALVERLPVDPAHPGQRRDVLGSGHDEPVGIALLVGKIGQAVHPALEGHTDAHEVAVHQLPDAGETATRIPQPAHAEQDASGHQQGLRQRQHVVAVAQLADDEGAQHQHHNQQEQQQAVNQVHASLRRAGTLSLDNENKGKGRHRAIARKADEQRAKLARFRTDAARPRSTES